MGMPGVPPVVNKRAIELAIKAGILTNCKISNYMTFDKKNYYYPDLPSGYQITQLFHPICTDGYVDIETDSGPKRIRIQQIHIEEDAGKQVHDAYADSSLVDYNRAGVPLIEIVSMPDFRTGEEVTRYLEKLRSLLTFADVSDGRRQEGPMRSDVNLSVREMGSEELGIRTEMKNINSLKAITRAIAYESERHIDALETGFEEIVQETRRWDDNKNKSYSMRTKEDATDYRYFPNSELTPVIIDKEWIEAVQKTIPELAHEKYERYMSEYGLSAQDCGVLTTSKTLTDIFDDTMKHCNAPKEAANWLLVELMALIKPDGKNIDDVVIDGGKIAKLIELIDNKTVNRTAAKEIFAEIYRSDIDPEEYASKHQMGMVSDEGLLTETIKEAIAENPGPVAEYREGKKKAAGFLMGIVMKKMGGKADPKAANAILLKLLGDD
jgi:aspartyl-tRNA(Asn)/glutamyl-tRNA(Gln) amidotransferase subunit B